MIEIITPGQTPEVVGKGLFECGKFPGSSVKTKEILNSSVSMRDLSCEKDCANSRNNRFYGDNEPIPVYQRNKSMKIYENPYSPNPESDLQE